MARHKQEADDFDSPWKNALQAYLPQFLAFFFPNVNADIDWRRGFEALDKEFQKIVRRAEVGKHLADKLFKVWLKDGGECWLLIHIEIQGDYEKEFPARMFEYNIAAHRRYNQPVVSLAVLCDDNPQWRPTTFSYGQWGYEVELTFGCAKLLDYVQDWAALDASENPFAAVVQAQWQAKRTRDDPDWRRRERLQIFKGLYKKKWTREQIHELFGFIEWIMTLPESHEELFRVEIEQYEQEKKMQYVTYAERYGFKKGLEKGKEEGKAEGLIEAISLDLEAKFGKPGLKLLPQVRKLDLAKLRQFTRFLKTSASLQEVRDHLAE